MDNEPISAYMEEILAAGLMSGGRPKTFDVPAGATIRLADGEVLPRKHWDVLKAVPQTLEGASIAGWVE